MATTYTRIAEAEHVFGDVRAVFLRADITSYTTGGDALAKANHGLERVDTVLITGSEITTAAIKDHGLMWDRANGKLLAVVLSTGVEVAAAVDLGEHELLILGK